jgi:hypothetical protein
LGLSPTCDCVHCREHRLRRLQAVAISNERELDLQQLDVEVGLRPAPQAHLCLPPSEATPKLKRKKGELSWADFWTALQVQQQQQRAALSDVRKVARRCGFSFSARMVKRTAIRQLRAVVSCPDVLSLLGECVFSTANLEEIRQGMEEAFRRALEAEKQSLEEAARAFGFSITEMKPRKGLFGSWTACTLEGAVPLHAKTPGELRRAMHEAANAAQAPHVEASTVEDERPTVDEADVVEEPPERTEQRARVRMLYAELEDRVRRERQASRGRGALVTVEASA